MPHAPEHIAAKLGEIIGPLLRGDMSADQLVADNSSLDDSGLDSLDKLEIVMAIEEEFDIEISDQEAADVEAIADLAKLIEQKTN